MSEPSGSGGEEGDPPAPPDPPSLSRLDPDRAASASASKAPSPLPWPVPDGEGDATQTPPAGASAPSGGQPAPSPIVDTRRYRWMIGIFGLALVVVVSIYQFATHGVGTTGVPPGQRLHLFSAPLADTNLEGDPNPSPPCTLARHDPRVLNTCLLARRGPLVLAFFVTGSSECERQVDALQTLSHEYPASDVSFAAVGIQASHKSVASLVRSHGWTIPVAYDADGTVGGLYGVAVCPMLELAYRGGIVRSRLIGLHWQTAAAIGPPVRALIDAQRARDAP